VILKPNEGVGAGGTHQVGGRAELEAIFPTLREDYILEEFIEAPIVTYDGLTDENGNIVFENTLIYGEGLIEYTRGKDTFFYVGRRPGRLAKSGPRWSRGSASAGSSFTSNSLRWTGISGRSRSTAVRRAARSST
jgi:hypothetical protein